MPQSNAAAASFLPELRSKDYERYAVCLFAAPDAREDLAALFLFNAELAQIRDQITEPLLGQIRLQWWRDGLDALGTAAQPPHALLTRLAKWQKRGLSLTSLQKLLDNRHSDLQAEPFSTSADWLAYRDGLSLPLTQLAVLLTGNDAHQSICETAMTNYATIRLLRSLPAWLRRRQNPLPPDWRHAYGMNAQQIMELHADSGLSQWALEQARSAMQGIRIFRQNARALPQAERQKLLIFSLHNDLASFHARRIIAAKGDIFAASLRRNGWRLPYLFWRSLRG